MVVAAPDAAPDVNVGLVGFGVAGRQHAEALAGASGFRVAAVVEANAGLTTGALRRLPSWEVLLADPGINLVGLCLPPGGRADLALEALKAGKAVLLEAPPALCEREVDLMVATAEQVGRPIGVMLQHRHRLPEAVRAADWSAPSVTATLEVSRFRPPAHFHRTGWRSDPTSALGGAAAHLAVHYVDLACQLLGDPSGVWTAPLREVRRGIDTRVTGVVEFASGATLSFTATSEAAASSERLRVLGPDHSLAVDNGTVSARIGDAEDVWPTLRGPSLRRLVYQDMAEAMRSGGRPRHSDLDGARAVTRILRTLRA
ncbi:Gfo/Idh/MocA family protein [Streptomyces sp. NBC_00083]|uniref:Gfo/Idh/MocA family protein n=1 Tax=Streptomyces sp. NBC_00083 TaxID=2975647 RepID=UPI0022532CF7|nr:Gfo/Idh/MocA family oxidoreductase [Streptomyces sp. NBC_00083]MCX5383336.1 Gfo/Idh/MocA family oxidoreductase [Streptomyces sp. NBC_00083]